MAFCNGTDWVSMAGGANTGGGAATTPAGSSGDIQFNSGGNFAADTGQLYWDTANKRLGIGTDAPVGDLHVSGTVPSSNVIIQSENRAPNGYSAIIVGSTGSRGGIFRNGPNLNTYGGPNATNVGSVVGGGDVTLLTANAVRLVVKHTGEVGIGLGSGLQFPSTTLHVQYGASGKAFANNTGLIVETSSGANNSYAFQVATGANNDAFSIANSGRVGIGTTAPTVPVEIVHGTNSYGFSISTTAAAGDGIVLKTAADTANNGLVWLQGGQTIVNLFSGGNNTAGLNLLDNGEIGVALRAGTAASYIMNGAFGLGTTAPARMLHISNTVAVIRLQDSDGAGAAANPYVEFHDAAGTRTGYVGDGSTSNQNIIMLSDNGNVQAVSSGGTCTYASGASWSCSSDARMKNRIEPLADSLEKVIRLQGVTYHWKDPRKAKDRHIGLIAQDVRKVFPDIVRTNDDDGMLQLDYAALVVPLVEAVKELNTRVGRQEARIRALEAATPRP